jgi:hypothetical protein
MYRKTDAYVRKYQISHQKTPAMNAMSVYMWAKCHGNVDLLMRWDIFPKRKPIVKFKTWYD